MPSPEIKHFQDSDKPESTQSGPNLELVENKTLVAGLDKIGDSILHDTPITTTELSKTESALKNLKVNISGIDMTIDQLKNSPEMKRNIEIWQEIKANNFNHTNELTLITQDVLDYYVKNNDDIFLNGLKFAQNLVFPKQINGWLFLDGLTSAQDLILPKEIDGHLSLDGLTSAQGLIFPEKINGSLFLKGLTSAQGLILPEKFNGDLSLNSLTSAQGLRLPEKINDNLYLNSLTSAQGLILPKELRCRVGLSGLSETEKDELKKQYPNLYIE